MCSWQARGTAVASSKAWLAGGGGRVNSRAAQGSTGRLWQRTRGRGKQGVAAGEWLSQAEGCGRKSYHSEKWHILWFTWPGPLLFLPTRPCTQRKCPSQAPPALPARTPHPHVRPYAPPAWLISTDAGNSRSSARTPHAGRGGPQANSPVAPGPCGSLGCSRRGSSLIARRPCSRLRQEPHQV